MFKQQDLQMFGIRFNTKSIFHRLEVIVRGYETQFQAGDNLNCFIWALRVKQF